MAQGFGVEAGGLVRRLRVAGDAVAIEHRLHEARIAEGVGLVHIGLQARWSAAQGECRRRGRQRGVRARLVAALAG